jgi:transposase
MEDALMRPYGSAKLLEKRRRKAMELLDEGLSLNAVGRRLGCAPISVQRWRDERARKGEAALKPKPVPGRPGKLTERQKKQLAKILLRGAINSGYRTEIWTTARIADVIARNFGVSYHRDHIGRLLKSMGFSWQKPEKRALDRDEARIEQWKRVDWPRIKKTPRTWVRTSCSSTNPASC